jgi:hypothetical protein
LHAFGQFLVVFGGVGPYVKKIHRKTTYNDLVAYDPDNDTVHIFREENDDDYFFENDPGKQDLIRLASD